MLEWLYQDSRCTHSHYPFRICRRRSAAKYKQPSSTGAAKSLVSSAKTRGPIWHFLHLFADVPGSGVCQVVGSPRTGTAPTVIQSTLTVYLCIPPPMHSISPYYSSLHPFPFSYLFQAHCCTPNALSPPHLIPRSNLPFILQLRTSGNR